MALMRSAGRRCGGTRSRRSRKIAVTRRGRAELLIAGIVDMDDAAIAAKSFDYSAHCPNGSFGGQNL